MTAAYTGIQTTAWSDGLRLATLLWRSGSLNSSGLSKSIRLRHFREEYQSQALTLSSAQLLYSNFLLFGRTEQLLQRYRLLSKTG